MSAKTVTPLDAVDNALLQVIADCYNALNKNAGTEALQRFLARPNAERMYIVKNDSVQDGLRKLTRLRDEPRPAPPQDYH
ncbi:MAG: hypothetical protein IJU37_04510 [Desulfovibrio sp.]|nr:hypothetical protein [Desulfovibrio sp.]